MRGVPRAPVHFVEGFRGLKSVVRGMTNRETGDGNEMNDEGDDGAFMMEVLHSCHQGQLREVRISLGLLSSGILRPPARESRKIV